MEAATPYGTQAAPGSLYGGAYHSATAQPGSYGAAAPPAEAPLQLTADDLFGAPSAAASAPKVEYGGPDFDRRPLPFMSGSQVRWSVHSSLLPCADSLLGHGQGCSGRKQRPSFGLQACMLMPGAQVSVNTLALQGQLHMPPPLRPRQQAGPSQPQNAGPYSFLQTPGSHIPQRVGPARR